MRRLLLFASALAVVLVAPGVAGAGGFATVGLSSTPAGTAAGEPWNVDITVLQHGRTPLDGVVPRVQISSGGEQREFTAKPTGESGVYRAEVVFPTAGRWDYAVLDGFTDAAPHTFPSVGIGDGAGTSPAATTPAAPDDGGGIAAGWLWGAGAALALALLVLGADRLRRRPAGVPAGGAETA